MRTTIYSILILAFLSISLNSCVGDLAAGLRQEIAQMKKLCPIDQGEGVVLTDVNFYETEKIVEYVCSIEDVFYVDEETIDVMKDAMIEALDKEASAFERFSIKTLFQQGYVFRYIFTDTLGGILCSIVISINDFQ